MTTTVTALAECACLVIPMPLGQSDEVIHHTACQVGVALRALYKRSDQLARVRQRLVAGHDPLEHGHPDADVYEALSRCQSEQRQALAVRLLGRRRRTYRAAGHAYRPPAWLLAMAGA